MLQDHQTTYLVTGNFSCLESHRNSVVSADKSDKRKFQSPELYMAMLLTPAFRLEGTCYSNSASSHYSESMWKPKKDY